MEFSNSLSLPFFLYMNFSIALKIIKETCNYNDRRFGVYFP